MWSFAVGLYLVELTPNNLRLAGLYGLSNALTVVLFGPVVGNWVDTNTRLKGMLYHIISCFVIARITYSKVRPLINLILRHSDLIF